ncbi:glycosyl hydrolase family 76-domain-containing protein [Nemania sp. NC0429]|nr:glycosyl hydrolase family 76-domain-containing protein [Nemania sp. NC0429]
MAGVTSFSSTLSQALLVSGIFLAGTTTAFTLPDRCPVFFERPRICDPGAPASFLPASVIAASTTRSARIADDRVFTHLLSALNVTQSEFFAPWLGTWPDAIDWTAAVVGTHISGATRTISEDLVSLSSKKTHGIDWRRASNLIDDYFAQTVAYYFGQDAVALRDEAYDDILWVVLGWLEAIQFVNAHSDLHYASAGSDPSEETRIAADGGFRSRASIPDQPYHGNVWIPAFSHRARLFWDLASHGWDTELCNGGMLWNPRLLPYKNAITNELYIAASISMYLYFPGDANQSPFHNHTTDGSNPELRAPSGSGTRDAKYLKAAIDGYRWLSSSNMTNSQGLFVDGFHISGYLDEHNNNTSCDARDETVYSYNQGVILTGQRGLWDATGAVSFLADGHNLIQSVIRATGYNLTADSPIDDIRAARAGVLPPWHGLGRLGVMEDYLDASGSGSQDLQTFKGIFFHHLAAFCAPLAPPPPPEEEEGKTGRTGLRVNGRAFAAIKSSHAEACGAYAGWLEHNVHAAMGTQDASGRFGQWWTAGLLMGTWTGPWPTLAKSDAPNATDYRNHGVPADTTWRSPSSPLHEPTPAPPPPQSRTHYYGTNTQQQQQQQVPLHKEAKAGAGGSGMGMGMKETRRMRPLRADDPNDRGRGRTIETQSGGLGLLRAYWKIARVS